MSPLIFVITGSGNNLLPDGTKPLPKPILTYCQVDPGNIFTLVKPQHSFYMKQYWKCCFKISAKFIQTSTC